MPFVNTEIRNDIIESFPTLLNKETYYRFLDKIDLQRKSDDECDIVYIKNRWRIPSLKLKRMDSIDRDWSMMPVPLLHHMPDLLLEPISLFLDDGIDTWDWKKLNYFPIINTNTMFINSKDILHSRRIELNHQIIDKLTLLEQLTTITSIPTNSMIVMNYSSLLRTEVSENKIQQEFLPQRNLKDYEIIQACLKDTSTRTNKRTCELDTLRFRFD